ncbi:MAG: CDP-alcohol phosphatidyltransferase family protein [Eubacterium sp.]|nr:CDP-alcohol phosphatidyltransferase family protein [Eubacterium sp.]
MIGVYNYTVILTYLSMLSGTLGILVCLHSGGHPYMGVFFLLFCGLCDAFDGKVARHKKDRTQFEKSFGIQIDSFSDLVAFGILPGCIGFAMLRVSDRFQEVPVLKVQEADDKLVLYPVLLVTIILLYSLAALIRLAYYNVTEEERAKVEGGVRKYYVGLPVTNAALIFPTIMLLQFSTTVDITPVYFAVMAITAFLFLSKIHVPKLGMKGLLVMVGIGIAETVLMVLQLIFKFKLF